MTVYLVNGFSESMLCDPQVRIIDYRLTQEQFIDFIHNSKWVSRIGHQRQAEYLSQLTGVDIECKRRPIKLKYDDIVIKCSLDDRLPENPKEVKYEGRCFFTMKRLEKQSAKDILKSEQLFNKLLKMEE